MYPGVPMRVTEFLRRRIIEDLGEMERAEQRFPERIPDPDDPVLRDTGLSCEVLIPWSLALRMRDWRGDVPGVVIRIRPSWGGVRVIAEFAASGRAVLAALRRNDGRLYAELSA